MEQIIFDLRSLDESSQRELARYRELGPVYTLKRMTRMERRRHRRIQLIKKILSCLFYAVCIAWALWVLASWLDVGMHNADPNPTYQPWNIIHLQD